MSLFPTPGATRSSGRQNAVEFRAGRMELNGRMVVPDKRKGLVYVHQSEDGLTHFCWKDRSSGAVEEDSIIFPDDTEFKKVPQCTTGRVFLLKFKSSDRKLFFWMQEPKADKDDELCEKVNRALNNTITARSPSVPRIQELENLYSPERSAGQRRSSFRAGRSRSPSGTLRDSTTAAAANAAAQAVGRPSLSANPIEINDLQRALSVASSFSSELHLSSILSPDILHHLVHDSENHSRLLPHIPDSVPHTPDELQALVHSPQFNQALNIFNAVLQSEHIDSILAQFGFDLADSGGSIGLEGFLRALQRKTDRSKQQERRQNESAEADLMDSLASKKRKQ